MSGRPDLALTEAEQRAFLEEVLTGGAPVAYAVCGADGYPEIGLVDASFVGGAVVVAGPVPADGESVCLIVERGETYDDITAVVARGTIVERTLPLDDLVTFAFAKLRGSM
jgi:hypothetical protein